MKELAKNDFIASALNAKDFFRTLSHREFFSAITLSLVVLSIKASVDYVVWYDWHSYSKVLVASLLTIAMMFNHVFYRIEHKRSNNFIGRIIHDLIFLFFNISIATASSWIFSNGYSVNTEYYGGPLPFLIILVAISCVFEMIIFIIKRILIRFKWEIL